MTNRRDFFRLFTKDKIESLIVRPPFVKNDKEFYNKCIECEDTPCILACEEEIIFIQEDTTPTINFEKRGCTFCEDCANACDRDVISLNNLYNVNSLNISFQINTSSCIAHNDTICFSCKEPCVDDAILFNGLFNPIIDETKCTGCGFCYGRCPTKAIEFKILPLKKS